jgi:arylsulfatase A
MDRAAGQIFDALDRLKLAENTIVVFTSDNGPETLDRYQWAGRSYGRAAPLRGMKLWTTEAGVRVPGIVRWPAQVKAGQVTDEPMSSLDFLPTFAALAGAGVPAGLKLDGADARSALNDGTVARTQPLFWVYFDALNAERVALRDGRWKLLAQLDGGKLPKFPNITTRTAPAVRSARLTNFALYDLSNDIGEARDLSTQEPEQLKKLSATMERLYRELTSTMHVWPDVPLTRPFDPPTKN